ncbi:MAG: NAD regulator [Alphaproteobacteria bacterium 32-64-14]|nr:MAG: NAD regulator [Alphaproteobacteria bacterium 32-64-14]
MSTPIAVGLSAVIVAATGKAPSALETRDQDGATGLPHGRFDPKGHRTFELGLRAWVRAQTGFEPGYVEQLYTFGDLGRELPQAELGDAPAGARLISVGYLGLTPEQTDISAFDAVWRDWYDHFPWEDHRKGRPVIIDEAIAPVLWQWAENAGKDASSRRSRIQIAFGLDGQPWIEERTLERYELMYEAGLAPEAARDGRRRAPPLPVSALGEPMISDHRRILATAIGRLRGKIKYRPVVFELMPERFTLFELQQVVESLLGLPLHKQNFRRSLDRSGLVIGLGLFSQTTGGRPAELFRFRREAMAEGHATGVQTPRA